METTKTSNLETQTPFLWIILGRKNSPLKEEFSIYINKLVAWCQINARLWTIIGHDKDIDDDGLPKFRHIHALIILKDGLKPRLITSLGRISKAVGLPKQDIDIEKPDNISSCIRYCLHKGYPEKYQYSVNELITNLSKDELSPYLDLDNKTFTASYLIQLVELCGGNRLNIMKQIGLSNYQKFRNCISDIRAELGYV